MSKIRLRFEWSHEQRRFIGPILEGEPDKLRENIADVHKDIAKNSEIVWRPPYYFMAALILVAVVGYTASYLMIVNRRYKSGTVFLIMTPVVSFGIVVALSLRSRRFDRIQKYLETKSYDYQSSALQAGCDFSYLLLDGSLD
jgi:hypothetical protein